MFKKPDPEELLRIANETLAADRTGQNERYITAMAANATAIAERQSATHEQDIEDSLLKAVYGEDNYADWKQLAADFRSAAITEQTHPQILDQLMTALRAELAVSNPKFRE